MGPRHELCVIMMLLRMRCRPFCVLANEKGARSAAEESKKESAGSKDDASGSTIE